jgi:hypothetical protein
LREYPPEQVIADRARVGVLLDGQAVGQCQYHGDHLIGGEPPEGRGPPEELRGALGDSGIGSAANAAALQIGGALGVAVIGSVLSARYQDHMTAALVGQHLPAAATHTILGSLGGTLSVAGDAGGAAGAALAQAARTAFMSGNEMALAVAAAVALGGAVIVLARLPSRTGRNGHWQRAASEPGGVYTVVDGGDFSGMPVTRHRRRNPVREGGPEFLSLIRRRARFAHALASTVKPR